MQRCHDAITVTWKTRHFRHFTSEHYKISKSEVFEKSYSCSRFLNLCCAKNCKSWWPVKLGTFSESETHCIYNTVYLHMLAVWRQRLLASDLVLTAPVGTILHGVDRAVGLSVRLW